MMGAVPGAACFGLPEHDLRVREYPRMDCTAAAAAPCVLHPEDPVAVFLDDPDPSTMYMDEDLPALYMDRPPEELMGQAEVMLDLMQADVMMYPVNAAQAFPTTQRRRPCRRNPTVPPWPRSYGIPPPSTATPPQTHAQSFSQLAAQRLAGIAPVLSAIRASSLPASMEAAARRGALAVVAARAAAELEAEVEAQRTLEHDLDWQEMRWAAPTRRRRRRRAKGCLQLVSSCSISMTLEMPTEDKCTICLEAMEVGEEVSLLPCLHMLHKHCATKYFSTGGVGPVCPVCRAHMRATRQSA